MEEDAETRRRGGGEMGRQENKKKKNQTWGPLFCLFILLLDVLQLVTEMGKAEPDQTMIYLYGFGVVIIFIALIVAIVKKAKDKKNNA